MGGNDDDVDTAARVARGESETLPDPPETFSDSLPAAIWV